MPPSDMLRRSTRQRSGAYMNFDLENSRVNGLSGIFGQSIFRTNSKGLFNEDRNDRLPVPNPNIKQTSSFD